MVSGNAKANARHGERFTTSSIASTGPNLVVAAQPRFPGSAAGFLLFRLLLVSAPDLVAELPRQRAASHNPQGRHLRLASVFGLWCLPAIGRVVGGPPCYAWLESGTHT